MFQFLSKNGTSEPTIQICTEAPLHEKVVEMGFNSEDWLSISDDVLIKYWNFNSYLDHRKMYDFVRIDLNYTSPWKVLVAYRNRSQSNLKYDEILWIFFEKYWKFRIRRVCYFEAFRWYLNWCEQFISSSFSKRIVVLYTSLKKAKKTEIFKPKSHASQL